MSRALASTYRMMRIKDVCDTTSGGTPLRDTRDYYDTGTIPWVKSGELKDGPIYETAEKITERGIKESSAKVFPAGTLLIALYGATVGKLGVLKVDAATNQAVCAIFTSHQVDREYLFYYLLKQRDHLIDSRTGGAQPNISQDTVRNLPIPLPPLPEQQRIAAILERADRLRRLCRYALELSAGYLQAVFVEMFGDPVRNPKGWKVVELGDIGEIQGGLQLSSRRDELPLKAPYLRVANVYRDRLDLSEIKMIGLTEDELRRLELNPDDLLLVEGHGNIEEIGRCAMWNGSIPGCVHQNHLIRVRINRSAASSVYASRYLNGSAGRSYFREVSNTTSGLNTISTGIVKRCPILLPPINHQSKFALVVLKQERLRTQQREAARQAEQLFGALLERAFRGEL